MSFENPWAFLVLLAIPVLIIIYLIRNKFKEATAPSTYLWELSEKFLKKRNPLHKLEHLLALIVQCLTIACLAVALAHPVLVVPGGSENYVYVLDASASMKMLADDGSGKTRFELAQEQIINQVEEAANGSSFTLILADDNTRTICSQVTDKDRFEIYVDSVSPSSATSDLEEAMANAQTLVSSGACSKGILVTDKVLTNFTESDTLSEIYVGSETAYNRSVYDLSYTYIKNTSGTYELTLSCYVVAYIDTDAEDGEQSTVDLSLNFRVGHSNSAGTRIDFETIQTVNVTCTNATPLYVSLDPIEDPDEIYKDVAAFSVTLPTDTNDVLSDDDQTILYLSNNTLTNNVLLVTDQNNFLSAAFTVLGCSVDTQSPSAYDPVNDNGYDITVFDGYTPSTGLPEDGAVWLMNTDSVDGCGFISQGVYSTSVDNQTLTFANNTDSLLYNEFTKSVYTDEDHAIVVSEYYRYSTVSSNFTTILTYGNLPVLFAGKNDNGQREVVFGFDIHNSNLPLTSNFIALVRNFVNYSNPLLLDEYTYDVGDEAVLSFNDDIVSANVQYPDGTEEMLSVKEDTRSYPLDEVGTYVFTTLANGSSREAVYYVYVNYPKEEENPRASDDTAYQLVKGAETTAVDGIYDELLPVVIACAVLFACDWFLYAHEQY